MAEKETSKIRQDLIWHQVSYFLESLEAMSILYEDEEYQKRLLALTEYVNEKIEPSKNAQIFDIYVVMEQEKMKKN